MLIRSVELRDFKSHARTTVRFAPGTNAICGANTAGKTTLLQAIGLALFDYPPRDREELVREGARAAVMTVAIESARDERLYEVTRRIGAGASWQVLDPEVGIRLASDAAEVQRWLREHFGLSPSTDLRSLFESAVGVPQGEVASIFMQPAGVRTPCFNRILRVEEYRDAYGRLLPTLNYLRERIAGCDVAIAGLAGRTADLPRLEEQEAALRGEIAALEGRVAGLAGRAAAHGEEDRALEGRREALDSARRALETRRAYRELARERAAAARVLLEQAAAAARAVEEASEGHAAYLAAEREARDLQERQAERDGLRQARGAVETRRAAARSAREGLGADLARMERAAAEVVRLAPGVLEQTRLEAEVGSARERADRLLELERGRPALAARAARLKEGVARCDADLERLARLAPLSAEVESRQAALDATRRSVADLEADQRANRGGRRYSEGGLCPFLKETCRNVAGRGGTLTEFFEERLHAIGVELEAAGAEVERRERSLAEARDAAKALAARAPLERERAGLTEQLVAERKELATLDRERAALAGAAAALGEARAALEALGAPPADPRTRSEVARSAAARRPEVAKAILEWERALSALEAELRAADDALGPYADLDERLRANRAALDRHRAANIAWLANREVASEASARRQALREREAEATAASGVAAAAEEAAASAAKAYDAGHHARVRADRAEAEAGRAAAGAELAARQQQAVALEEQIVGRRRLLEDLAAARAEHARWTDLHGVLAHLRDAIKEAGPMVTAALVRGVSHAANRIFGDLIGDHSLRLRWTEDYEIRLEQQGRERGLHPAAGSERVTAALAVRLALLQSLGEVRFAFFDEPTIHLDETRRTALVDQLQNLRGFDQLFVISHDDTFERATGHVVRVEKRDGVSVVADG